MDKPVRRWVKLGEQLSRERNEFATLALGPIKPTRNLRRDRAERGSRRPPQPRRDTDSYRSSLVLRDRREIVSGHHMLQQKRTPGPA